MDTKVIPNLCPKCQAPLPADAPQGLCPKCLFAAVATPTDAGQPAGRPATPSIGEIAAAFPQLEILEFIGQGGMGFVFKARQPKLDRLVALKILPQSLAADPTFAERFNREARLLARLNHPGIVTVHDFGVATGRAGSPLPAASEDDNERRARSDAPYLSQPPNASSQTQFYYLLMEFVDGVNLRQAMQAGRFTPEQALAIVPKICEALQFAHNEGILHRDIKPENILLDAKGRVKIADFGIAKLVGDVAERSADLRSGASLPDDPSTPGRRPALHALTEAGKTLGTPNYMAPEQLEGSGEVDHRADIYSLGVVFYEMLTGELPRGRFAPPSEKSAADPRVDEVVLRALAREKTKRPASAEEMRTQVVTITETPESSRRRGDEAQTSQPPSSQSLLTSSPTNESRFSRIAGLVVFALAYFGLLLLLAATADTLPPRVASHFGAEGRPNGWMSREYYLAFVGCLPFLFGGFAMLISWLVRRLPARFVNIPRRDYWLTTERRPEVAAFLRRRMFWLASLMTGFFAGLHLLTVHANRSDPPHLSMDGLLALVMGFLISVLVWIICLIMRLAEVDKPLVSRGSRRDEAQTERPASGLRKSQMVQIVEAVFNITFTSRRAVFLVNLSALGFLGFLSGLSYLPFPAAHYFKAFAGAFGLFGLIGAAFAFEFRARRKTSGSIPSGSRRREEAQTESERRKAESEKPGQSLLTSAATDESRFSRTAIVGAGWGLLFVMVCLAAIILQGVGRGGITLHGLFGQIVFVMFGFLLLIVAAAPFGTTILGWVAVSQIRRSAGKLQGLWLAVFDGLLFPLMAISFIVFWLVQSLFVMLAVWILGPPRGGSPNALGAVVLSMPVIILLNRFIIRRVWRAVNDRVDTVPATAANATRLWRWLAMIAVALIAVPIMLGPLGSMLAPLVRPAIQSDQPANPRTASAETWSPTLAPGEKMDFEKFRQETADLIRHGKYEEALQRCLWYHNHALQLDPAQSAVRLSFAMEQWGELAFRYPKARQAMAETRDRAAAEFAKGGGSFALFQEVSAFNERLLQEAATLDLFDSIRQQDPRLARQCFFVVEKALVEKGEYAVCATFIPDFKQRFEFSRDTYLRTCEIADRSPGVNPASIRKAAHRSFVNDTRMLIEILVGVERKAEAENIQQQALAVLNIPQLQSAVSDAEEKVRARRPVAAPKLSFGPVVERTIYEHTNTQLDCIDFDTDNVGELPSNLLGNYALMHDWMSERGFDAMAWQGKGLSCPGMTVVNATFQDWQSFPAATTAKRLEAADPDVSWPALQTWGKLPSTWIFRTAQGGMGLLQITGFTENPRGVKIRYKLVQSDQPIPPVQTEESKISFGQSMEWVLPFNINNSVTPVLNIDSGRILNQMPTNGSDRLIGLVEGDESIVVSFWGGVVVLEADGCWNLEEVQQTKALVEQIQNSFVITSGALVPVNQLPKTFLIKTRDNHIGLLQITGFTENPRGVKLRYKLVQQSLAEKARDRAVQAIEAYGGFVTRDSDGRVIKVSLVYDETHGVRRECTNTSDRITAVLPDLPDIEELLLQGTQASDFALRHVARLPKLKVLMMWTPVVTDHGMESLKALKSLETLHASDAGLGNDTLAVLATLPKLKKLALQHNQFTDAGLAHLSGLTNLTSLWIGTAAGTITDQGLVHLKSLTRLQELELQDTEVTDAGLGELNGLKHLRRLYLGESMVSEAGRSRFEAEHPRVQIVN